MAGAELPLRFQPFSSSVDVSFWQELGVRKLHAWKLDARPRPIAGFFAAAPHPRLPSTLAVRRESFVPAAAAAGAVADVDDDEAAVVAAAAATAAPHEVVVPGVVINVNTAEEFKSIDKKALLAEAGGRIWRAIGAEARGDGSDGGAGGASGEGAADVVDALVDPAQLARFVLVSFADLKNHRFVYWFGFPALAPAPAPTLAAPPAPLSA
eukprot:CAMPEP_0203813272 /NCGR_PEP_ID=MMETSP0115-20131106/4625_1 /ASSEMBLY_ACC=CAM_ASM_000227 /TAXON_ID=33651 /ORGANISM="Bicosoecid sp, Strain ms1" /LENGTH=209 /DNA_ID=CAMNT_0050722135 /DNA_START=6 /DNA_END=631 /DNA_ORIENTATION=-